MPKDTEHVISIHPVYNEKILPFIEGCALKAKWKTEQGGKDCFCAVKLVWKSNLRFLNLFSSLFLFTTLHEKKKKTGKRIRKVACVYFKSNFNMKKSHNFILVFHLHSNNTVVTVEFVP